MVLEKIPESPLDKEIKPVNLKANQPWMFIGRIDAEAPVFWSPDENSWLIGKVPDVGKDSGQKEKRVSEDEMAWWHHQCNGHELWQTSRSGEGQGGLACCSSWSQTWLGDWTTTIQSNKSSNYLEKLVVNLGIHTRLTMLILNWINTIHIWRLNELFSSIKTESLHFTYFHLKKGTKNTSTRKTSSIRRKI